jgi:hypothetical protein
MIPPPSSENTAARAALAAGRIRAEKVAALGAGCKAELSQSKRLAIKKLGQVVQFGRTLWDAPATASRTPQRRQRLQPAAERMQSAVDQTAEPPRPRQRLHRAAERMQSAAGRVAKLARGQPPRCARWSCWSCRPRCARPSPPVCAAARARVASAASTEVSALCVHQRGGAPWRPRSEFDIVSATPINQPVARHSRALSALNKCGAFEVFGVTFPVLRADRRFPFDLSRTDDSIAKHSSHRSSCERPASSSMLFVLDRGTCDAFGVFSTSQKGGVS